MAPEIIFLHLQKTGGTSIRIAMQQAFADVRTPPTPKNAFWHTVPQYVLDADAIHGHMRFGLHAVLIEPAPYFTVIREPAVRHVSRYRRGREKIFRPRQKLLECHQPRWGMVYQLSGMLPKDLKAGLTKKHVDLALKNIEEHFLYVGRTSKMDEVGLWMRDTMGWSIDLPIPRENQGHAEAVITDDDWARVRALPELELDYLLYNELVQRGPKPQEW